MASKVILVRHGEVESKWKPICYGQMDVPLSLKGQIDSRRFARSLANIGKPTAIYHSNLIRTHHLADCLAEVWHGQVLIYSDLRLRERNYGEWEGKTWDEVFASDPGNFHDLIDQPDTYRPPGGETTTEMQMRMREWFDDLSEHERDGPIIAVTHSGPIAALCGSLLGVHAKEWSPWIIGCLESVRIGYEHLLERERAP